MLSPFQAIIFGLLQGFTELFPVSSLGHSVILPKLLGWNINQKDPFFLIFIVATHTATAFILFIFFFKDWKKIIKGLWISLKNREIETSNTDAKLGWLLIISTIPAGILGILFEESLKNLFAYPKFAAFILILNGFLLYFAEIIRKKNKENSDTNGSNNRIAKLSFAKGIKIGLLQSLALIPGFSRTGASLTGALLSGLSHEDAVRFSFLLATPIIGAASILKFIELFYQAQNSFFLPIILGMISAGIGAYFSVKFLTKYFRTEKLTPFALYCIIAGSLFSFIFLFR